MMNFITILFSSYFNNVKSIFRIIYTLIHTIFDLVCVYSYGNRCTYIMYTPNSDFDYWLILITKSRIFSKLNKLNTIKIYINFLFIQSTKKRIKINIIKIYYLKSNFKVLFTTKQSSYIHFYRTKPI